MLRRPFGYAYAAIRTGSRAVPDLLARVATAGRWDARTLLRGALERELPDEATSGRRLKVTAALAAVWATGSATQEAALATYLTLAETVGADQLDPPSQQLLAQLALLTGQDAAVRDLALTRIAPIVRHYLTVDRTNPWLGCLDADAQVHAGAELPSARVRTAWERLLGAEFAKAGLTGPSVTPDAPTLYDGLTCERPPAVDGPLVTVVMPCYRPDAGLLTSVRSILAQSHENLEILMVDDASGPGSAHWFDACRELDPRIRVIQAERNGGTYAARNLALHAARGELITFQDADDWSHPARIAAQVAAVSKDEEAAGSVSDAIRAKDDLTHQWLGYPARRRNASSLMVRRAVVEAVGGFDPVRKSADSEFYERIQHAWGPVLDVPVPLAITRLRAGTLSRSDFRYQWTAPDRLIYRDQFRHWHATTDHLVQRDDSERPFPAPASFLGAHGARARLHLDLLVLADLSTADGVAALQAAVEDAGTAATVGVLHREDALAGHSRRPEIHAEALDLAASGQCLLVSSTDPLEADLVLVPQVNVLLTQHRPVPDVRTFEVLLVPQVPRDPDGVIDHVALAEEARALFCTRPRWAAASIEDYQALLEDGFERLVLLSDEMATIVGANEPGGSD
ncbi:glycosyltransferase family 2 protein [Ruania alba]|uniref:glycosyltransferase family 2 protein n=1 Tax=Ruania alba TaxID=648782 RepID=UPI000B7F6A64|nr:glycosyltransferase family A protein [Ruania alba]